MYQRFSARFYTNLARFNLVQLSAIFKKNKFRANQRIIVLATELNFFENSVTQDSKLISNC